MRANLKKLFLVLLPLVFSSAQANTEFTTCERLLSFATTNLPEKLLPVDLRQVPTLERSRIGFSGQTDVWTLSGSQNAARFKLQLITMFDKMLELSFSDTSSLDTDLNAVRESIGGFVDAFTDHTSGYVDFSDLRKLSDKQFKLIDHDAEDALTSAAAHIQFTRSVKFANLQPIPHFLVGNESLRWDLRIVPDTVGRGFRLVVKYLHNDISPQSKLANIRFRNFLTDDIFLDLQSSPAPSPFRYKIIEAAKNESLPALRLLEAFDELPLNGNGRVDGRTLRGKLLEHLNVQMFKYFCETARLCERLNGNFAVSTKSLYNAQTLRLNRSDGTYHLDEGDHSMYLDMLFIESFRPQYLGAKMRQTVLSWNEIHDFIKTYVDDENDVQWEAEFDKLRSDKGPKQSVNMKLLFDKHDNFFAHRLNSPSLFLTYEYGWNIFGGNGHGLEQVDISAAKLYLTPSDESIRLHDLQNIHIELLIGRLLEILNDP